MSSELVPRLCGPPAAIIPGMHASQLRLKRQLHALEKARRGEDAKQHVGAWSRDLTVFKRLQDASEKTQNRRSRLRSRTTPAVLGQIVQGAYRSDPWQWPETPPVARFGVGRGWWEIASQIIIMLTYDLL